MAKQRLKKKDFPEVSNQTIVGIKWYDGDKGFILHQETGFCCVNKQVPSTKNCISQDNLNDVLIKFTNNHDKVFVFGSNADLFKWYAK